MSMPRQITSQQFDLFSDPQEQKPPSLPHWQSLPEGTRQKLTELMVRLILDHVGSAARE